ncbi:hypothetical protein GCM10009548_89400 [Streptomyces malaysiensis subsp. malaysiensis]|uniref:Uncharacterized protein n=1 Tax=Streptomyces malaysiensis TaxID=92644 RepID=A0ABX6WJ41_STRMQ|nr:MULTISPECIES: hypothetical protein [Streptomyces]QPI61329.1 hypothetical protein I1A49_46230 [Streptomyces solisilvae]UHH23100.1 hypothetical protein LUV23_46380 [Streptomyces sp. HNM0561]
MLGQGNAEHGGDQRAHRVDGVVHDEVRREPPRDLDRLVHDPVEAHRAEQLHSSGTGLGPVLAVTEATAGFRDRLVHGRADLEHVHGRHHRRRPRPESNPTVCLARYAAAASERRGNRWPGAGTALKMMRTMNSNCHGRTKWGTTP